MQWSMTRRLTLGGIGLLLIVLTSTLAYRVALAAEKPGSRAMMGDLNDDGVANLDDLPAFAHALQDPAGWQQQYNATFEQLLAVADFDGDGDVGGTDRTGFIAAIQPETRPRMGPRGSTLAAPALTRAAEVDLDVDSDNDNGTFIVRDTIEDGLENDPSEPGKIVRVNDDDDNANGVPDMNEFRPQLGGDGLPTDDDLVALVLETTPAVHPGATHPMMAFRLSYPPEVRVWWTICDPQNPGVEILDQIEPDRDYAQMVWIRGDMNGDGVLSWRDIDPLVLALSDLDQYIATSLAGYPEMHARAADIGDFNHDHQTTWRDVDLFVAAMSGGSVSYVSVYTWVEGLAPSVETGNTPISAVADTDLQNGIDPNDAAADIVRTTVRGAGLGAPPSWGGALRVSPYSVVNLENGNVLTALTLTSWDPVGPPVHFTLYHNSLTGPAGTDWSAWGFNLGKGWSVCYGAHIIGSPTDQRVTVVGENGASTIFTREGETNCFNAPPGRHEILEWQAATSEWILLAPDQSKAIFDSVGRLTKVLDSVGNEVTVDRTGNPLRYRQIESAAEGLPNGQGGSVPSVQWFSYYDDWKLRKIENPGGQWWNFEYDDAGRLKKITLPHEYPVQPWLEFEYVSSTSHQIMSITQRVRHVDGDTYVTLKWGYVYTPDGKLQAINDYGTSPTTILHTQTIAYASSAVSTAPNGGDGLWTTTYTDRRSHTWQYKFDGAGNLREGVNPLGKASKRTYDADHNVLTQTDTLGNTWSYTYGPVGNLTGVASPLAGQEWVLRWIAPNPALQEPANMYRLWQTEDPVGYVLEYGYPAPGSPAYQLDPTLVTSVTEPAAPPLAPAVTTIDYYLNAVEERNARGHVKLVTDANGVEHLYEYDPQGYYESEREGLRQAPGRLVLAPGVFGPVTSDGLGRPTAAGGGSTGGYITYGPDGTVQDVMCCIVSHESPEPPIPCTWEADSDDLSPGPLADKPADRPDPNKECLDNPDYDLLGRPENVLINVASPLTLGRTDTSRQKTYSYDDPMARLSTYALSTTEPGAATPLTRTFNLTYDPDGRVATVTGPDGLGADQYVYDAVGRPVSITRAGTNMGVVYHYDDAGRLEIIEHTDGANVRSKVVRHYDAAGRIEWIEHRNAQDWVLLRVGYLWNLDNTVDTRTETEYEYDALGNVSATHIAATTFGYDARKRLTTETRILDVTTTVYDLEYRYDQLGNRTHRIDHLNDQLTCYVYDTDWDPVTQTWPAGGLWFNDGEGRNVCVHPAPLLYGTRNNRLLETHLFHLGAGAQYELRRTVSYAYFPRGNVANITIKDEYCGVGNPDDYDVYHDLAFTYGARDYLWLAIWQTWEYDSQTGYSDHTVQEAWEFRYDESGRQRYYARRWTPHPEHPTDPRYFVADPTMEWTDYLGAQPYGDCTVSVDGGTLVATPLHRYLAGLGIHAQQTVDGQGDPTVYLHGDMVRSTMLTTDEVGAPVTRLAYTAFGEPVTYDAGSQTWRVGFPADGGTRYGYAGGFGYESGLITLQGVNPALPPVTLQHVGERWYDPALGRFVQRDPIGIMGGFNVYAYCSSRPLVAVDPEGLSSLYRPDAFVHLIENELMQSSFVNICVRGTIYVVVGVRYEGGRAVALILQKGGEILVRNLPRAIDVTQSPSGGFVVHNPPKACGATGLETAPLLLWYYLRTRRRCSARVESPHGCTARVVGSST